MKKRGQRALGPIIAIIASVVFIFSTLLLRVSFLPGAMEGIGGVYATLASRFSDRLGITVSSASLFVTAVCTALLSPLCLFCHRGKKSQAAGTAVTVLFLLLSVLLFLNSFFYNAFYMDTMNVGPMRICNTLMAAAAICAAAVCILFCVLEAKACYRESLNNAVFLISSAIVWGMFTAVFAVSTLPVLKSPYSCAFIPGYLALLSVPFLFFAVTQLIRCLCKN